MQCNDLGDGLWTIRVFTDFHAFGNPCFHKRGVCHQSHKSGEFHNHGIDTDKADSQVGSDDYFISIVTCKICYKPRYEWNKEGKQVFGVFVVEV